MDVHTIDNHIQKKSGGELTQASTIRNFRIVQQEAYRNVQRKIFH